MAKKNMSKLNKKKEIPFEFNLSEKQYLAFSTPATEIFFGGKVTASSHSNVLK